jgi:hypothetical protein
MRLRGSRSLHMQLLSAADGHSPIPQNETPVLGIQSLRVCLPGLSFHFSAWLNLLTKKYWCF